MTQEEVIFFHINSCHFSGSGYAFIVRYIGFFLVTSIAGRKFVSSGRTFYIYARTYNNVSIGAKISFK